MIMAMLLAAEGMHNDLWTLLRKLEVAGYLDAGGDKKQWILLLWPKPTSTGFSHECIAVRLV